jgi:DNA-binding transcriptional ArsR family regulator
VGSSCTPAQRIAQLKSRIGENVKSLRGLEDFYAALGDATRLKMLKVIGDEELCACEVMATLELTQPTTSHHLGILERGGVISARRNGKWMFYRISNPKVRTLLTKGFDLIEEAD